MISLIFPNQLFADIELWQDECYLIEEWLYFKQYKFHKQKLVLHRASMKSYEEQLIKAGKTVHYIDSFSKESDCRNLIRNLKTNDIHIIDVVDDWLRKRIKQSCLGNGIKVHLNKSPLFLNKFKVYSQFFERKKYFHHDFYRQARKRENLLLDQDLKPVGGKWSYDESNRKKYPRNKIAPSVEEPEDSKNYKEANDYVNKNFPNNYGQLNSDFRYPINHQQAKNWLQDFLENRFDEFGDYEDAIVADEVILNHSLLTPMLNIGLLTPIQVIKESLKIAKLKETPLNSLEGFIRQIIGWREFMYGLYESVARKQRTSNFWQFKRKIPASFYTGDTGIVPIDNTITKVLKTGYCHHIERLMILGNFMLLCEFDPDEVYQWFMELFIDAYDWVMVPNIYGMSQFADGGLMATKPYISGSNYLAKMSNYKVKSSEWAATWDGLFWHFMHKQRKFFESNPRIGMLLKMWDKMPPEKQSAHLTNANRFLVELDQQNAQEAKA